MRRSRHHGFTLVEIAIVLVIIGLLLGGVLKGQALIDSAKVKNLTQDFRSIPLVFHGYQDRFRAAPGDDAGARRHLCPAAVADCTTNGNGDGRIGGNWNDGAASEAYFFWQHARMANLLPGITDTANAGYLPRNAEGGRLGIQGTGGAGPLGVPGAHALCSAAIPGRFVRQIDLALDDGEPASGALRAGTEGAGGLTPLGSATPLDESGSYVLCLGF